MRKPMSKSGVAIGVLAATVWAPLAMAQESSASPTGGDKGVTLEVITVTAQRREQSLQAVPIAVSAFTSSEFAARSFNSLADIATVTPSMVFTQAGQSGIARSAAVFIRGIGALDSANTVEPGVGIYVDGIYFGRTTGSVLDLDDIERVEILRGPQGTLFGRNTIGGAINITTAPPANTPKGSVAVTAGGDNRFDINARLSGPISDTLGGKIAYSSRKIDGTVNNIVTGHKLGSIDTKVVRAALRWEPNDRFDLTLSGDYSSDKSLPGTVTTQVNPDPSSPLRTVKLFQQLVDSTYAQPAAVNPLGPDIDRGTTPVFNDGKFWGVSADANWRLSDTLATRVLLGHRRIDSAAQLDGDGQPAPFTITGEYIDQRQTTAEVQLLGKALDQRLDWVGGLFYMTEESSFLSDVSFGGTALFDALEALPGPSLPFLTVMSCPPACVGGAGNPLNTVPAIHLNTLRTVDAKNAAAFLQTSYKLTDRLTGTVGLRYSRDDKDSALYQTDANTGVVVIVPAPKVYKFFDYRVGLDFQLTDDALLYVTTSSGHKSGGVNPRPLTSYGFKPFDPEKLTSVEVGVKTEWLDGRTRLNGALFHYDYDDVQVAMVLPVPGGTDILIQNGGKASLWGAELEARAQVTRPFLLSGSLSYLDWKWDQIAPGANIPASGKAPFAPQWTVSGEARYTFFGAIAGGDVNMSAGAHWQDETFLTADNSDILSQGAYATIDTTVGWTSQNEAWKLTFYGRNLGDKQVKLAGTDVLQSFGFARAGYSRGREWGITFRYAMP